MADYDSREETVKHILVVRKNIFGFIRQLWGRWEDHDKSKLEEPEKSMYDRFTPLLRGMTYGSDEYKKCLADMGPALAHHYENNSHHPEHYKMFSCPVCSSVFSEEEAPIASVLAGEVRICPSCSPTGALIMECSLEPSSGIYGMTLVDLVEMLADWKAASMRHSDGDILKSLEINKVRFGMSDQLYRIFRNTVIEMEKTSNDKNS